MAVADHYDTTNSTVSIDGTQIGYIDPKSVPFPKGSTAKKDTTTLNSGYVKSNAAGWFDPGDATFTGNYYPSDPGQIALKAASKDRTAHTITINVPLAGMVFTWVGIVGEFWASSNNDNTLIFNCKIFAQGMATVATTSAGCTSIAGAAVGVAYSPTAANTALLSTDDVVIIKETTGITTDTVTVTAASASGIYISYDEGVTWTTLTTATPATVPTASWPSAGMITKAKVQIQETNKADRFIRLYIARA